MEWGGKRREKQERGEKGKILTGASPTLRTTSKLLLGAHWEGLAVADLTFTFSWVSKFTLTSAKNTLPPSHPLPSS